MTEPRLTIGIPTLDRFDHLANAIQNAVGQQLPCKIIVADQGKCPETAELCKEWEAHPYFKRVDSPATKLWSNWRFTAQLAVDDGAEFFMWLQDDDYISEKLSRRIVLAFDHYPAANVYCSNLKMSYDGTLGCLWVGNWGPRVPVDIRRGVPQPWPGDLLVIAGYFDSWCMSPAKAFRVNDRFQEMLETLPDNSDCFTERIDIAKCATGNRFIVDPKTAGCWHIHGKNESQITGALQPAQVQPCYEYLDGLMDDLPTWRQDLLGWMSCLGNANLIDTYYKQMIPHGDKSPYAAQIIEIFEGALKSAGVKIEAKEDADANGQLVPA